jgi:hypothetical protein
MVALNRKRCASGNLPTGLFQEIGERAPAHERGKFPTFAATTS